MTQNKALIIGYGYLGEAIADYFEEKNWQVIKASRTEEKNIEQADLSDLKSLEKLAKKIGEIKTIIHCASSGRGGEEAYKAVFDQGTKNLIAAFPKSHIIFTSSSSVYAQIKGETVTEESETKPTRTTSQILIQAEKNILKANGSSLRLSGIYGENRSVILKKFRENTIQLEEDGRRILNQIHRRDAAKAFFIVAEKQLKGIYNITETDPKTQGETLKILCAHYKKPLPASAPINTNRKRAWTHKKVSNKKMRQHGWKLDYPTFTQWALQQN